MHEMPSKFKVGVIHELPLLKFQGLLWLVLSRCRRDAIEHILRLVIECSSVDSLIQQVLISDNFLTALFDHYHDFTDFDGRLYGNFWVNNIRPNCF
jgi:hypothetical protein